ncbi:MAG: PKD domain-containing protein [Candidatus Aenigmarchaeota archaeon]|nr:PKD domain-containing protein [Candidatus Aenigmarchaeota archaeon]
MQDPGIYECEIEVETCCFGFIGDIPETEEYSDVSFNDVSIGSTYDMFCNVVGGDECDYDYEDTCQYSGCYWYGYMWYDNPDWEGGKCFNLPCSLANNQGCQPGDECFPVDFDGSSNGCCSCWVNGAWCGSCSDPEHECSVKSPKYCHDVHYGGGSCQGFGPGGVNCVWDSSHTVLEGLENGGMLNNDGVDCSRMDTDPALETLEKKYTNLLGFYHFQDLTNLNYICCFAADGTLSEGMHCVRNKECASGICTGNVCVGSCDNDGICEPGQGETHANCPNDCPCDDDGICEPVQGETHANCPNDCECDTDADCDSWQVCCSNVCYDGECCTDEDCDPIEKCIAHYCEPIGCFLPGTEIKLADGSIKNIENIEIGDEVLSFANDGVVEGIVAEVYPSENDHYYILKTGDHEVGVTKHHEFYVGNGEFKAVRDLSVGDEIYILVDGELVPEKIVYKELVKESVLVYNMKVEGTPTYFANGFAVHNKVGNGVASESEMETENVHFSLYLNLFNLFNLGDGSEAGVGGTRLSFASLGCLHCDSVTKTFDLGNVELLAGNTIELSALGRDSHGLKHLSITCDKLYPPTADAGDDQAVNLTDSYVTVTFSGAGSSDSDGEIVTYEWDFGDGSSPGSGVSPTHNYYDEDRYTVTLTVTDDDGLTGSDTMSLAVNDMPTITDDYAYDGIWVNTDQTVILTAQDASGIDRVMYCQGEDCNPPDGSEISGPPYTLSFTQDIDKMIRYKAWDIDIYDNPSETGEFKAMIDKTAPVTTDDSDTQIHGNGYVVTLTCTDEGSGCDETYYCVSANGSNTCNPTTIGTSATVACPAFSYCEKVIKYYSIDIIGNQESTKTSNVIRIDTRIPTCEMTGLNTYTTSESIGLSWSGEDPGGSEVTGYRVWYKKDSGSWNVWNDFSGSVESGTFAGEGESSYDFRCQAKTAIYPNGGIHSTTVSTFVDTTPPTASMDTMPEWANQESFSVSWSGDDSGSGVKDYDVEYSTSPPSWTNWLTDTELTSKDFGNGDPINVNDGETYHFRVMARDNAGLEGEWSNSENISVDIAAPTCSITDLPDYIATSDFPVSWSGDDSGSGVKDYDVEYSLDEENWVSFASQTADTSKNASLTDGEYYFRCMARDIANNAGDWSGSESVIVDTRAPGAGVDYESHILGGKNITINATIYDVSNITSVDLMYGEAVITETKKIETYANRWNVSWTFPVSEDYGSDEFIIVTEDIHGNSRSFEYSFSVVLCEEEEVRGCGTDVGECKKGSQTCVDGMWGECLGGLSEMLEVCDGKDNDCDGMIDDGIQCSCVPGTTRDCGTDTGECSVGTQTCTSEQIWGPCGGNYIGPEPEICDGKDNDCDGEIDNGANCCPEGKKRPCGFSNVGICELGQSQCIGGVWGSCIGSVMPEQHDICDNGLDDDCDGETDEGCGLCNNNVQDEGEDGVDCGGPCEPCPEFPWIILSIIGVVILVVLLVIWKMFRSKGEELTWEALKGRWS